MVNMVSIFVAILFQSMILIMTHKKNKQQTQFTQSAKINNISRDDCQCMEQCMEHTLNIFFYSTYLCRRSMERVQMFFQRLSRLVIACCIAVCSSVDGQASASCSNTSHRLTTDATPELCFSMSRCSS